QEVFLRIWRHLSEYDGRASLYTWIYTIARNLCLTELARQPKFVPLPEDKAENSVAIPSQDGTDPESAVTQIYNRTRLRTLVDGLPAHYRRVLVLYYYQHRPVREGANMLGMPEATVRTQLRRAKLLLLNAAHRDGLGPEDLRLGTGR